MRTYVNTSTPAVAMEASHKVLMAMAGFFFLSTFFLWRNLTHCFWLMSLFIYLCFGFLIQLLNNDGKWNEVFWSPPACCCVVWEEPNQVCPWRMSEQTCMKCSWQCERSSYAVYLWVRKKTQIVTHPTAGRSHVLLCNRSLLQMHENTQKVQHIMDCSHKCAYLLCSPALLCPLSLYSQSPPPPCVSDQYQLRAAQDQSVPPSRSNVLKKAEIVRERYMWAVEG